MSALQLSLRSHTRPPSGGAGRWWAWGPRGRVAPQLQPARQPAGQTKGLPAMGGASPPQLGPGVRTSNARDSQHLADFFSPYPKAEMQLQRGLLAPGPWSSWLFCPDERGSLRGTKEGKFSWEEGGETSGRVDGVGDVAAQMDGNANRGTEQAGNVVRMRPGPTIPSASLSAHSTPRTRKIPFPVFSKG